MSAEAPFGDGGFDWRRYVAALLRYKWLVVLVTVVGTAVGIGATRLIDPEYEAQAKVLIESRDRNDLRTGAIRPSELFQSQAGYIELLYTTDLVLSPVAEQLQLYLRYTIPGDSLVLGPLRVKQGLVPGRYRLVVDDGGRSYELWDEAGEMVVERGAVGDSIGRSLGFEWAPQAELLGPGREIQFGLSTIRDVAEGLGRRISTSSEGSGNFLTLTMRGGNPERVAAILNAVCERFVRVASELKNAELNEEIRYLEEQLGIAKRDLEQKEGSLQRLRVETITLPREGTPVAPGVQGTTGPAEDHYFGLRYQRDRLQHERAEIQRVLAAAGDSGIAVGALSFVPSVQNSPDMMAALQELTQRRQELRVYKYDYTDEHPAVQSIMQRIATLERVEIPRLASALLSELESQQGVLGGQIESASRELRRIPSVSIEESRLERDVDIAEGLYTNLQGRYVERQLAMKSTSADVRVLDDAAVPRTPINGQQRPRIMIVAFMLSFGLGVLGAVLLDRIDPKVRYPEQVSHELGIPILGTVPHAPSRDGRVSEIDMRPLVEAFRGIRLSLIHTYGTAGPVLITVSSPGADDGKTFVGANLALAFADLGQRTLVIDGDVRRGCLHTRLGGFRKPGLIDYLAGRTSREQIIQSTGYASVDLIASGTRMQNAPELLQSANMSSLIARLRSDYDVILIDSPPLAAGVDPLVLATLTGNLLLVLRTGSTDRELLEAKLDMLAPLPIRLLGAVLNGVQPKGSYRYYSYYYSYLPGYESQDEQEAFIISKQLEGGGKHAASENADDWESSDDPSRWDGGRATEGGFSEGGAAHRGDARPEADREYNRDRDPSADPKWTSKAKRSTGSLSERAAAGRRQAGPAEGSAIRDEDLGEDPTESMKGETYRVDRRPSERTRSEGIADPDAIAALADDDEVEAPGGRVGDERASRGGRRRHRS
ncbi:MAG: polysaccharide biosynthesis tyrosine autokinase [Gemmatimonadota bacterium]|nr:MAG: polysaccharide biosynthesis tyrosine autokinase [Gemmatimonadota bacterium]